MATRDRARFGVLTALALSVLACGEDAAARNRRVEARVLKRQIDSLEEMIRAAGANRLVEPGWLAVAIDETAVRTLLDAGLPYETVVNERFRVRVESADVAFQGGAAQVSLRGHVVDEHSPDRRIAVLYQGGLDDITVSADGHLQARLLIDDVRVPEAEAGGSDATAVGRMLEQLAGRNIERLQAMLPVLAIPVRLQQSLSIDGLGDGPVQVDPGELPVSARVTRVLPLSGRLWVFLDVKAGPWRARATAEGGEGP